MNIINLFRFHFLNCKLHKWFLLIFIFLILIFNGKISYAQQKQNQFNQLDYFKKAIFTIRSYNQQDSCIHTSHGFFIDTLGKGISFTDVFENAYVAKVFTSDSSVYLVDRIVALDENAGIVKFSVNSNSKFNYIHVSDDVTIKLDDKIYVLNEDKNIFGQVISIKFIKDYGNSIISDFDNNNFLVKDGEPVFNQQSKIIGIAYPTIIKDSSQIFIVDIHRLNKLKPLKRTNNFIEDVSKMFFDNYYLRGLIAINNLKIDTAIAFFTKAILENPHNGEAFLRRAELYIMKNDYKKAIMDFTALLETDIKNDYAYYNIAYCYYNMKMFNEGFDYLAKAITYNSKNQYAYKLRADILFELGSFNEAISDCDNAINIDNNYGDAYFLRALCRSFVNNRKGACEDLNKAADLNIPNAAELYQKMCQ